MATLVSRNGKIQVKIRKNGANKSSTFATKYEANVRAKQKQNIVNQKKGHPKVTQRIAHLACKKED
tara:strand:- start:123 stop:320 length:198 start_codon:yes stop_codon:yes gene_type:complete